MPTFIPWPRARATMPKPELLLPLPGPVSTSNTPCSFWARAIRSCMIFCLAAMRLAWRSGSLARSRMMTLLGFTHLYSSGKPDFLAAKDRGNQRRRRREVAVKIAGHQILVAIHRLSVRAGLLLRPGRRLPRGLKTGMVIGMAPQPAQLGFQTLQPQRGQTVSHGSAPGYQAQQAMHRAIFVCQFFGTGH